MPPKSRKGAKPPVTTNKVVAEKKTPSPVEKKSPTWFRMGVKRVAFNELARKLSDELNLIYGMGFSISHFEKALLELQGMTALREKIYLPDDLLHLHAEYVVQKSLMIEEQRLFSSSFQTEPLKAVIATTADELFRIPGSSGATAKTEDKGKSVRIERNPMESWGDVAEEATETGSKIPVLHHKPRLS